MELKDYLDIAKRRLNVLVLVPALALLLVAGANTVAVEIHQDAGNSSDLSFDLMLWGESGGGPPLSITYNPGTGTVTITWSGGGTLICTDDPTMPRSSWSPVAGAASPYVTPASAAHRFYAVRVP